MELNSGQVDAVYTLFCSILYFSILICWFSCFQDDDLPIDVLMELVQQIVSFHMKVCSEWSAWLNTYLFSSS
jgi:hypothetical protein